MRVEIFEDVQGQHRYRIRGDNGEIMATSEGYSSKSNAQRGLEDLRASMHSEPDDDPPPVLKSRAY